MRNATVLYGKPDIEFFLNAGPTSSADDTVTLHCHWLPLAAIP
jgi:hypothetical protein